MKKNRKRNKKEWKKKAIKEEEVGINEIGRAKRKGNRGIEGIRGRKEERRYEIQKIRNKEENDGRNEKVTDKVRQSKGTERTKEE